MIAMLDRLLKGFLLMLVAAMILTVSWQVIARYILNAPSSITEELARFQLIWLGFIGAVYTFRNRSHVAITTVVETLPARARRVTELCVLVAIQVFAAAVLVFGGARLVFITYTLGQTSPALAIKVAYIYSVIPISGVLIIIYAFFLMTDNPAKNAVSNTLKNEGV